MVPGSRKWAPCIGYQVLVPGTSYPEARTHGTSDQVPGTRHPIPDMIVSCTWYQAPGHEAQWTCSNYNKKKDKKQSTFAPSPNSLFAVDECPCGYAGRSASNLLCAPGICFSRAQYFNILLHVAATFSVASLGTMVADARCHVPAAEPRAWPRALYLGATYAWCLVPWCLVTGDLVHLVPCSR